MTRNNLSALMLPFDLTPACQSCLNASHYPILFFRRVNSTFYPFSSLFTLISFTLHLFLYILNGFCKPIQESLTIFATINFLKTFCFLVPHSSLQAYFSWLPTGLVRWTPLSTLSDWYAVLKSQAFVLSPVLFYALSNDLPLLFLFWLVALYSRSGPPLRGSLRKKLRFNWRAGLSPGIFLLTRQIESFFLGRSSGKIFSPASVCSIFSPL